jgi:Stress responsive A/B Barrel Domain
LKQVPTTRIDPSAKHAHSYQDGKPYIVYNEAKRVINTSSPAHDGYTLASLSFFDSKEDHEYYDKECKAHGELKKLTASVRTGVCVTVSESDIGSKL